MATPLPERGSMPPELRLLGATTLSSPAAGGHLACNPVMDLTATAGDGGTALHVWRAGDQLVSKIGEKGARVEGVRWKADGMFLSFSSFLSGDLVGTDAGFPYG